MFRSLLASIFVGVAVAIGIRGAPELESLVLVIAGSIMLPLFYVIMAAGAVAILARKQVTAKFCITLVKAFLLIGSGIVIELFVADWMRTDQIAEVEEYVLRAAPVLEDRKSVV